MHIHAKLVAATAAAIAILCMSIGTASAGRFSLSSQSFRAAWGELLFDVRPCEISMEGTFHSRTFPKVVGTLIGNITRVNVNAAACEGVIVLLLAPPWNIRYAGFTGSLPNITSIRVNVTEMAILLKGIEPFGARYECLYKSTAEEPARFIFNRAVGGTLISLRPDETIEINRFRVLSGFCPPGLHLTNASESLTVLNAATLITMTLI